MNKWVGLALITPLLAGCPSTAKQYHDWVGQSADDFFIEFGPPAREQTLSDGRRVVRHYPGSDCAIGTIITDKVEEITIVKDRFCTAHPLPQRLKPTKD